MVSCIVLIAPTDRTRAYRDLDTCSYILIFEYVICCENTNISLVSVISTLNLLSSTQYPTFYFPGISTYSRVATKGGGGGVGLHVPPNRIEETGRAKGR